MGGDPAEVEITILDLPVIGLDREDVGLRVERLRRTLAAAYAAQHHAGTPKNHVERYRRLADRGVGTIFCLLADLADADDLARCSLLEALRRAAWKPWAMLANGIGQQAFPAHSIRSSQPASTAARSAAIA